LSGYGGEVRLAAVEAPVGRQNLRLERDSTVTFLYREEREIVAPLRSLSNREIQVARLVKDGRLNKEIARELWVSESTVKFHLRNIYDKLALNNRTQLAAVFARADLEIG
jgi:DNA-binding NarL/FixJ family response regulator